jgi:hypothetical protein
MASRDPARARTVAAVALRLLLVALAGAIVGLVIAVITPAHTEIAGSDARLWLRIGRAYDEFGIDKVLTGRKATDRSFLGEPIGVRAELDLDPSTLTDSSGQFNTDVLPAYIQAYSDPTQLVDGIKWAIIRHLVVWAIAGAVGFVLAWCAWRGYRRWRRTYDADHYRDGAAKATARAYRAPERRVARYAAVGIVVVALLSLIPSAAHDPRARPHVVGSPVFRGTPLAGIQVEGLLRPALVAARDYIETYFAQTDTYYDQLQARLEAYLAVDDVALPASTDTRPVVSFGFVTDRHCNIGMDRVVVALLKHFDLHLLVSGGDDAFSGSFGFESACTRNLADKTKQAGITDVFVAGNHDSPKTMDDERHQGIKTLDGKPVTAEGLTFIGLPDPRASRYGQGIVPSAREAQDALLQKQGTTVGETACISTPPLIAVLHDPLAGNTALQHGCGHITLALDGHTHSQHGPSAVPLPDGRTGYQFTGASSGGAPGEGSIERSFASQLTVGPLNHDATLNIASVERTTGRLVAMTEFRFTPDQKIFVTRQHTG